MYYIFEQDTLIEGGAAVNDLPASMDLLDWVDGKIMPDPGSDLVLDLSKASGDYRGDIISGVITLYHTELKNALTKFGVDNIQYFPVVIRNQNNSELKSGYWIANIIGLIECVDKDKSVIEPRPSGIGGYLHSFEIDEKRVKGASIFRLAEAPTLVIVADKLANYLAESGTVGVRFVKTINHKGF
jgi:hypothetical protein